MAAFEEPVKVLLVSTHPVQYAVPMYRRYNEDPRVDVTVAYCSLRGAEAATDPDFGVEVEWDVPLLDGYPWVQPRDWSPKRWKRGFPRHANPALWSIVRGGGYDVIVCYGYRTASFWIAAAAAKFGGASLVLTTDAHSLEARDGSKTKAVAKRALLPMIFSVANGVFAPSTMTRNFLLDLGLPPERVFLTPFVVDNEFFGTRAAEVDRELIRARWGIPPDVPVALFCGKLVPWKRPRDLIVAGSRVDGLHMLFAGDGPLRASVIEAAEREGCSDRVRFLGFVNQTDLPSVYAGSDFLVLPSEYEPFGLVVNEAFACGIPAITTAACGAAGDLIVENETGHVVQVGDTVVLRARLDRLARDLAGCASMGEAARRRIDDWSPKANLDAFAEACLTLARRKETA